MRIDKFLKVSRILKRRAVSKELANNQRVVINGKVVKPSYQVSVNDIVQLALGNRLIIFKVLEIKEYCKKEASQELYEIIEERVIKHHENCE